MHALVFVLTNVKEITPETMDDVTVLNELPLAEYTEELPVQDQHFTQLAALLGKHFGKDNLAVDQSHKKITISRAGIIRYYRGLRAAIKRTIDFAMHNPIEDFILLRGESDWYAIKTLIDDPFATQFYMDGYGCGSITVFSHNLFVQMGYEQAESLTLELAQVFDAHY